MTEPLITSVDMREFRGIRACKEPIRLSRFTVLIGRNNSGKTSVLEAIALLPPCDFDSEIRFVPVSWTWKQFMNAIHSGRPSLVYGYTGKGEIRYTVRGEELRLPLSEAGPLWEATKSEVAKLLEVGEDELRTSVLLLPNSTGFLAQLADGLRREGEWAKVEKSGANTAVVRDLISKTVHDRFTEATVRFNSIVLRKELPDGRVIYVKAADLGDGVERILLYGLWLETYKPKVVLWDDIEASAHPGLIEAVLEWLASRDWQVVLTTHSYDVLDRLAAVGPEDATVVVLKKGPDDILEPKYFSLDELGEMLESHVDVRRVVDIL